LKSENYQKGTNIVVEGQQKADYFYIIQQGTVGISKVAMVEGDKDELGPGDFFGVTATMSSHSHIETATALTDVDLIAVNKHQFAELIQKNPQIAEKIILYFAKRFRDLNETLARLTPGSAEDDNFMHLYDVAEYYLSKRQYYQALYAYSQYLKHCPDGEKADAAGEKITKLSTRIELAKFKANEITRTYHKDTMLFVEGEPGDELFIIQKGSIKITKIVGRKEVPLATLNSSDIFGEMALLEGKPRAASAVAIEDTDVMAVNKANFELMIEKQPQIIARITTLLAERIWLTYKQLTNTMVKDPMGRMYGVLLIQLEKDHVRLGSGEHYLFTFGKPELISMAGLPEETGNSVFSKMLEKDKELQIIGNKIRTTSTEDILNHAEFYSKR